MAIVISGVNNNDKITAADGTIDLLSGVNYAGTVTAPGFTASNNITAASINVGNDIQVGNAGIITPTTLIGNVTGNVNHTSNLLLQISGSEKLRIANSGAFGLNGTNYGTSGQVLTSQGSGTSPIWSTVTSTTINSNTNNYLITGTGTADTLQGEANLTFNGTTLNVTGTVTASGTIESTGTSASVGGKFGQISVGAGGPYNTIQNTAANTPIHLQYSNTGDIKCNEGGGDLRTADIIPLTNNSASLGTNSIRWANIHTNDLNLSNEGSSNDVDGTWGQYTIQEGENDLFLINKRSGKRYKFLLQEID